MAWFVVKYRKSDGTMTEAEFEAADKSALFKILAEKKISAINIQPGRLSKRSSGRRSVAKRTSRGSSAGLVLGILAVVAVAVAAFVVWFMFFRSASESRTGKPIKKISRTVRTPPVKERPQPSTSNVVEQALPVPTPPPVGNVITARSSRAGRVMTLMDGTVVTNTPQVIFERDFERGLMVALRPGGMTGGLFRLIRSRYSDEEILAMLKEMTIPDPDDDDVVRQTKENVQALKERALIAISEGASVSQILDELQRQGSMENLIKADAMKLRAEALRTGDPELVRESVKKINEMLEHNGIRKLDVPAQFEDKSHEEDSPSENGDIDEVEHQ